MAIANNKDLTHVVRTTQQWQSSYDKYECIPEGVLCIEFTTSGQALAKIGNGRDIFSKLPYIGGTDLTNYYTKSETAKCVEEIIKANRFIRIKGILQNKDQLPSNAECGDLYFVISQNQSSSNKYDEYVYSPSNTWENLGSIPIDIDLSEYAKIVYVDEKIDEVNERIDDIEQHGTHTHANKDILDLITAAFTAEEKDKLSTLYNYDDTELRELITQASHTHSNKDILDAISAPFTKEDKSKLDQLNPYDDSILKEKITALERLAHEHSNKRILDRTTASFTTEYERKMRWIRLYTGCTGMEEGIAGLVPAAQAGEEDYVLSGSGEWVPQTGGGGTYTLPIATASTLGGIKVGNGLEIDANGVLSTTGGGGGGDSIAEGGGITITTDPQTGVKTISVNAGTNLEIDPVTGELNVTGGSGEGNYSAGEAINIRNISGNLPPGYVEVDYIEGNGNCYTVIDYIPNRKTKIVGSAALISTTNDPVLFGARTGSNGNQFVLWFNRYDSTQAKVGFVYGTNTWSTSTDCNDGRLIPYVVGEQFTFLLSLDDEFNINDTFVHNITENGAPADYLKLGIFALVDDSSGNIESDNQIFAGRMYEFKIYEDDVLVVELIPAVNSTTGSVGFYDTVNDKFYTSNRSTQFTYDPSTVHVSGKIIDVKYGDGLTVNQDNELEVNTGNGLQINQDGEIEIDPSIIPDVPDYRAGDAIEIEHNEYHLSLTDYSNNDFIASIILSVTNGSISKAADNSSFVLSSSYDDCYTRGSNYGSNGSYPYTVKPLTQYRLQWDSASPGVTGYTMIFENGEYTYVHTGDQGTVSYIDFTTAETTTFIQVRFGIAYAGNTISISNIRLYEYVEDAFEYDKINVKYNKGLVVNQNNELEVALSDGLQFDSTASETMVADEMYLFDSRVTCQVHTDSPYTGFPSNRTYQKTTIEPALCCLWEVGGADLMWTGPLIIGLTETSVQYTTQDTSQTVNYQNTFTYLGKTWYTSGYPDFLNGADHEDKLGHLQYLGSYSTTADQIQAAKDLIDLANVRFVSNAGIQAKLGDGLQFDNNGAIEAPVMGASGTNHSSGLVPDPGSTAGTTKFLREDGTWAEPESGGETYEAGNGIEITEVTHEDEFRVQNQEYFFDTRGLTCGLNARVWTTVNDGDILAAMCIHNNGGNQVPLFVGLTEDSVKVSQNYDSNILGPNGSFDYRGKTWYFTADYALSGTDGQDTQNHIQTLPTTYSFSSTPSNFVPAAKDLIDLAVLLPDVSTPTINAKIGAGLSFDANGAIQADAQPLLPATDSTLGGVIIGEGINVDEYGEISLSAGEGLDIDFESPLPSEYTLVKGISSTANGNQYINTGYKIKPTTVIKMTCTIYKRNTSQWSIPLGTRNSSSNAYGGLLFVTCWQGSSPYDIPSLWIEGDTSSGTASYSDAGLFYNDIIELTFTNNSVTCYNTRTEDTIVLTASSLVSQPVSYDLFIFATNDVGTAHFFGVMDLYSLQIFEGSTKLYDYIPCQRNSDSKYGLYDIINDEFKLSPNNVAFSYVQGTPTTLDLIQQIKLLPATENTIGGVKPGDGILVDNDGTISVDPTIIPEVTEYEAGTAISIDEVEHGGVTFDAWDSGTGWENVCYSDSTGNSVINYQYEAHSPISNSYTLPAGATHIRAIAYDQNDTMLWTSFSWIDSNNYHFESTSPEDGHYDDWFEIPTGAVKVNFGVRHSKLNTTTAMSLNDIKSVDITVQTVSEIEVDVWNGGTGWLNGDYGSGTSNDFYTNWYYTYHYNYQQYIEVPEGATHVMVQGISNENDSHLEGGGCNAFDSNHNHVYWWTCAWKWQELSSEVKYVQPNVKWDDNNTRTISGSDVKSVTLVWKLPSLEINQSINVKYGDGLTVNQNNELEVDLGSGLQFDANGAIEVINGGDTIAKGDGITITTDPQTGVKTISVNTGDHLSVDSQTGELNVTGVDYTAGKGIFIGNEYQNVEYIKNSGNYDQIIMTDIVPNFSDKLEMDIKFGAATGNTTNDGFIGCTGVVDNNKRFHYGVWCYCTNSDSNIGFYNHFVWTQQNTGRNFINRPAGISYDGSGAQRLILTMQGTTASWGNTSINFSNEYMTEYDSKTFVDPQIGIAIFGHVNKENKYYFDCQNLTVYGVKLYDSNDTLLHNLVPVKKLSNNEGGLYDTVTNKFYGNSGNGSFITGPETTPMDDRIINAKIGNGLGFDSNNAIEVNTGDGLTLNQDNELEVNIGDGLSIDPDTGAINVTGGGGGDSIAEGDGITITTDSQTGVKTIGVNVGNGLEIDPNTGTLNVTGSSGGGSGNYSAGEAIDIRQSVLTNNIDAIRWDISEIKTNGGAWTQVRYVEFCDSSGTAQILSTGSGIWEDNTAVTYSHDPAGGGSQEITDMIANTRKMCAAWRGPGHTLKLTFILDTATAPSNIVKFRMKTGDDEVGRDPKAWKIYVRDSVTQRWYLVHETENAEVTNNRSTWSNYYNFSTPSDTLINVKYGTGLSVDPVTNELFVDGQLPEGTIIKKLTYTGNGSTTSNTIQFEKKPLAILNIYGSAGTNYIASIGAPIDAPYLQGNYGGVNRNGQSCSCAMSYNDSTNELTLTPSSGGSGDAGLLYNANNCNYTVWYLVKGHTGSGTSVNNEVSVVKTFSYTGTGTTINNIQFPETPDYILNISGPLGSVGDIITDPIDIQHPTTTSTYIFHWTQNGSGLTGRGLYSFNNSTNVLTLDGQDYGATLNYADNVYYVRYVVNETISSGGGSGSYEPGTAIDFSNQERKMNPDMTSDVLPYGEVIESGHYLTRYGWNAFDGVDSQTWRSHCWGDGTNALDNDPDSCYVGYVFPEDVYLDKFILSTTSDREYTAVIQTRSEGTWTTVCNVTVPNTGYDRGTYTLQSPVLCDAFRFAILSGTVQYWTTSSYGGNVCNFEAHGYSESSNQISVKYGDGLTVNNSNELEVNIGTGLAFDPQTGAINVTGGGGGSGDTVAEGAGIEITTDQQTGNKVIAVNAGTGLQVDQTTNELEIDDSVVTEDDELNLVFVPDDYQPS